MTAGSPANVAGIAKSGSRSTLQFLRAALPSISLALVILGIAWLNPRAMSYLGLNLMLNLGIPIALAVWIRFVQKSFFAGDLSFDRLHADGFEDVV